MRGELVFWLGLGVVVAAFFGASLFWELKEYDGTLLDTIGLTFTIIFLALSFAGLIFWLFQIPKQKSLDDSKRVSERAINDW